MNDIHSDSLYPEVRVSAFVRDGYSQLQQTRRGGFQFRGISREIPAENPATGATQPWLGFGKNIDRILDKMVLVNVAAGKIVTSYQVDERRLAGMASALYDEVSKRNSIEADVEQLLRPIKKDRVSEKRFNQLETLRQEHLRSLERSKTVQNRYRNFLNEIRSSRNGVDHYLTAHQLGIRRSGQKHFINLLDALTCIQNGKLKSAGGARAGSGPERSQGLTSNQRLRRAASNVAAKIRSLGTNITDDDLERAITDPLELALAKDFLRHLPQDGRINQLAIYNFAIRRARFLQ